ncbi:4903_t:CDS:2, partial [Entrophospora sp. SA101]
LNNLLKIVSQNFIQSNNTKTYLTNYYRKLESLMDNSKVSNENKIIIKGTIEHLDGLLLLSSIKNQNDKTKGKKAAKVVANNITKVVAVEKDQVDKKVDELEISTTNDLTANNGPATDVATSSDQINGSVEIINSDEDSDDDKDSDMVIKEIEEHIIKEYEPNLIWLDEHKGDSLLYYKIKLTITWKLNSENILANSLLKK